MDIEKLKKEIPHRWRVQSYSKYNNTASCVPYIDARDAMDLLDEVVGAGNWMDEYKMVGDMLFCGISIFIGNEWITKWDTGSESHVEKDKGHVSNSFKRAAVKWGVGRFLYNKKIIKVYTNEAKTDKNHPYVVDKQGKRIWDLTEYINGWQAQVNKNV